MFSPSPRNGATVEHWVFCEQDETFLCGFLTRYSTVACLNISQKTRKSRIDTSKIILGRVCNVVTSDCGKL